MRTFSQRIDRSVGWVLRRLAVAPTQFHRWRERYGRVNTHNGLIPRDHWLTPAERQAILADHATHAPEGYRRLTFMMLDDDIVAVSPATVYRVLKREGLLDRWNGQPSKKGTGFQQPLQAHEHWPHRRQRHQPGRGRSTTSVRFSTGRRGSSCTGAARAHDHGRCRDRAPTGPRAVSPGAATDHLRQRATVHRARLQGVHSAGGHDALRTSPYYPQANGKIERYQQTLKVTTIRPKARGSLEEARRLVAAFVEYYNHRRLHSAIGFITPADALAGRGPAIWAGRDEKLEAARARRRALWQSIPEQTTFQNPLGPTIIPQADHHPSPKTAVGVH